LQRRGLSALPHALRRGKPNLLPIATDCASAEKSADNLVAIKNGSFKVVKIFLSVRIDAHISAEAS
jgi:hypothetical protein